MADLITMLGSLSTEDREYKLSIKYKNGKVYCIFGRNGEDRTGWIKGPVEKVSAELSDKFKEFLQLIDGEDASDEVEDNLKDLKEEIEEEGEEATRKEEAKTVAKAASDKSKTKKPEPAKKAEPVKTALETAMEKLDKPSKASVTKLIERIKKGTSDPDVTKFLTDSLTNTLKTALGDEALVSKVIAEVVAGATVVKKEDTLFNQPAPEAAPAPVVPASVQAPPSPVQAPPPVVVAPPPAAPQPVASGFDIEEGDLF